MSEKLTTDDLIPFVIKIIAELNDLIPLIDYRLLSSSFSR